MKTIANEIIKRLQKDGYTAYIAGGAVRDMLLGLPSKDIDIATSATPDQIELTFSKTYPIAKHYGVMHVMEGGQLFEVATFRSDSGSSDGRHPDYVTFTDPRKDALRRDFTINGMFYDPTTDVIMDYVEGRRDLEERVVRFIGDPQRRIEEDHLRMLRAVRFAHQIRGQYEPKTYQAIKDNASLIQDVSWERVRDELDKMLLMETRAGALEDLQDLGLLQYILPEVEKLKGVAQPRQYHREGSVWDHAMAGLRSLNACDDIELIWAVLLHDVGKPDTFHVAERVRFDGHAERSAEIADSLLRRLRFPNASRERIVWAILHHMSLMHIVDEKTSRATRMKWLLHEDFPLLLELQRADASGTDPADLTLYHRLEKAYHDAKNQMESLPPKIISGDILIRECGLTKGKQLGQYLDEIYDLQLEGKIATRAEAIAYVKKEMGR